MSQISVNLSADVETTLQKKAASHGKSLEAFLQELAEKAAANARDDLDEDDFDEDDDGVDPNSIPFEEWEAMWEEFEKSLTPFPVIADDSRESIYEGCGE